MLDLPLHVGLDMELIQSKSNNTTTTYNLHMKCLRVVYRTHVTR